MSAGAQAARLPDGRLHLHHGPIDLIINADGPGLDAAFAAAETRFAPLLEGITRELDDLTCAYVDQMPSDPVARRMVAAVAPLADRFVTPMAAVAGAVADEICAVLARFPLDKVVVNNGGDIAFFLAADQVFRSASSHGVLELPDHSPVRGLATSGWRGRSQSLGIADAVTVFAANAARADAAATLIANAVDLPGHPAIERRLAEEVEAIPQLGARKVTVAVGPLTEEESAAALAPGTGYAQELLDRGLIAGALLLLNGQTKVVGSSGRVTSHPIDRL